MTHTCCVKGVCVNRYLISEAEFECLKSGIGGLLLVDGGSDETAERRRCAALFTSSKKIFFLQYCTECTLFNKFNFFRLRGKTHSLSLPAQLNPEQRRVIPGNEEWGHFERTL